MSSVVPTLAARLAAAVHAAFGIDADPELRPTTRPEFGHFQTNLPLRLAGVLRLPPAEVADRLVAALDVADLCEPLAVRAGFVNLTLTAATLAAGMSGAEPFPRRDERVVVDYSAPNVARRMLVHHLRSTVIGDALCRVLEHTGYDVIRQNHVGDWGTQFVMLIEELLDSGTEVESLDLAGLELLYRQAQSHFRADEAFADRSRARVVALHLYDLATALSVFYEQCPVLRSESEVRSSRLWLCAATQRVLGTGLGLLGIAAPGSM